MNKFQIFAVVFALPAVALNIARRSAQSLLQEEPTACSDATVPPQAEYVVFNLSTSTVDAACSDAQPGDQVADSCCTAPGGFNSLGKTFAEVYDSEGDSTCPLVIPPPTNLYIKMQCNSDNSITYGEGCDYGDSTCTSCKAIMNFGSAGCYRVNDLPGMNWFIKSEGCGCTCEPGTCTISEDPHIHVFDGMQVSLLATAVRKVEKAQSEETSGDKWLVKSGQVSIQARYAVRDQSPGRHLFVRAVAVGGTFLQGSSLIIGSLEDQITWNGQPILQGNESNFATVEGEVFIKATRGEESLLVQDLSKRHRGVSIELPMGVNLIVNRLHKYLNIAIKMPPQKDQEGLCGNFNGVGIDDTLEMASMRFDTEVKPDMSLFGGLTFS